MKRLYAERWPEKVVEFRPIIEAKATADGSRPLVAAAAIANELEKEGMAEGAALILAVGVEMLETE